MRRQYSAYRVKNNIWSGANDPLLAALTNPTELAKKKGKLKYSYPVTDKSGKIWKDAESAYKAFKTGDLGKDMNIMTRIIAAKLQQYPQLVEAIDRRGGMNWILSCSHVIGVKNSRWEGICTNSNFICCLVNAWKIVNN